MNDTISSAEMRDQFLANLRKKASEPTDWMKVVSIEGNRKLLALIANLKPASVAELSDLAERAQSNVSRSLAALVRAGLVELKSEGRVSRPVLTAFGQERVGELRLITPALEEPLPRAVSPFGEIASVRFGDGNDQDDNRTNGEFCLSLTFKSLGTKALETRQTDLNALAVQVLLNWWRILHRRDTPYRLCDVFLDHDQRRTNASLSVKSWGRSIEFHLRAAEADAALNRAALSLPGLAFERALLDGLIEPVAQSLIARRRPDQPIHSLLARLQKTMSNEADAEWSRTAGALGLCPYNLSNQASSQISSLIFLMPQEEARLDFASAVLTDGLAQSEAWICREADERADANRLPGLVALAERCQGQTSQAGLKPWKRGVSLAKEVRKLLSLGCETSVGGITGMASIFDGGSHFSPGSRPPAALKAFQTTEKEDPSLFFGSDSGPEAAAFVFARAIGDYICFRDTRSCVTSLRTDRQAVGRAFAAEFLAPAKAVVQMIDEDNRAEHQVAAHFGVTEWVISNQYHNNAEQYA